MQTCRFIVTVTSPLGLHSRPATEIVKLVLSSNSKVQIIDLETQNIADGNSVISILSLGCPQGTKIKFEILGEDAESLGKAIEEYFFSSFRE